MKKEQQIQINFRMNLDHLTFGWMCPICEKVYSPYVKECPILHKVSSDKTWTYVGEGKKQKKESKHD